MLVITSGVPAVREQGARRRSTARRQGISGRGRTMISPACPGTPFRTHGMRLPWRKPSRSGHAERRRRVRGRALSAGCAISASICPADVTEAGRGSRTMRTAPRTPRVIDRLRQSWRTAGTSRRHPTERASVVWPMSCSAARFKPFGIEPAARPVLDPGLHGLNHGSPSGKPKPDGDGGGCPRPRPSAPGSWVPFRFPGRCRTGTVAMQDRSRRHAVRLRTGLTILYLPRMSVNCACRRRTVA